MSLTVVPTEDPVAISDHLLDVTAAAYFAPDFDAFAACFLFPQLIGTAAGSYHAETAADLRKVFDAMRQLITQTGIIAMRRRTIAARYLDAETVQMTFTSQYMRHGHLLGDKTTVHGLIKHDGMMWKVAGCRYAAPEIAQTRALHAADPSL